MSNQVVKLTIEGIKEDLSNGLTRLPNMKGYDANIGSIQEKYNLSTRDVQELFKDERLKGLKTKKPYVPGFMIVEEIVENTEESVNENADQNI